MSTRTRKNNLRITDTFTTDRTLTITPGAVTITLLTTDRHTDQHAEVVLSATELDELAAEIQRIREERGI